MPWFDPPEPHLSRHREFLKKNKKHSDKGKKMRSKAKSAKALRGGGRIPKDIIKKAERLDYVRRMKNAFEKEGEELTNVLRPYVEERGKQDEKGHKAVWNDEIKIHLEPSPKIKVSPFRLFKLLGKQAFKFFSVLNGELEKARKDGKVDLTDGQLNKISTKSNGTPRVKVEFKVKKKHPRGLVLDKSEKGG